MRRVWFPVAIVGLAFGALGCSIESTNGVAEEGTRPGPPSDPAATTASEDTSDGGATPSADAEAPTSDGFAFFRVANFSDVPAIDFCVRAHDETGAAPFEGPFFASRAITTGLLSPLVTFYIARRPQRYDLRFVAPSSADCRTAIAPDAVALPALSAQSFWTFAVTGSQSTMDFAVTSYEDDFASDPRRVRVRVINLFSGPAAIDFGIGAGGSFELLFGDVRYRQF